MLLLFQTNISVQLNTNETKTELFRILNYKTVTASSLNL